MRQTHMRQLILSLSIAAAVGVVAPGCTRAPSPEPAAGSSSSAM